MARAKKTVKIEMIRSVACTLQGVCVHCGARVIDLDSGAAGTAYPTPVGWEALCASCSQGAKRVVFSPADMFQNPEKPDRFRLDIVVVSMIGTDAALETEIGGEWLVSDFAKKEGRYYYTVKRTEVPSLVAKLEDRGVAVGCTSNWKMVGVEGR